MEVDGGDVPTSSSSKDEDSGFDSGDGLTSSPTRIDQKVYEEREYQVWQIRCTSTKKQ